MRCNTLAALLAPAGVLPTALAHYNFESLVVNGKAAGPYEYVRSEHMVCNQGGLRRQHHGRHQDAHGRATRSASSSTRASATRARRPCTLSRAPFGVAASQYRGDGDWFKIYSLTTAGFSPTNGPLWASFPNSQGISSFTFKLPRDLPPGDYLMRAEHIGLHGAGTAGGALFYIGCAQLKVTGSGTGKPGPTVKFPGAYNGSEPDILINIYLLAAAAELRRAGAGDVA